MTPAERLAEWYGSMTPEERDRRLAARRQRRSRDWSAVPWQHDPARRFCQWPASDARLSISRDEIREIAYHAALEWVHGDEYRARMIAADVATACASRFVRWREKRQGRLVVPIDTARKQSGRPVASKPAGRSLLAEARGA